MPIACSLPNSEALPDASTKNSGSNSPPNEDSPIHTSPSNLPSDSTNEDESEEPSELSNETGSSDHDESDAESLEGDDHDESTTVDADSDETNSDEESDLDDSDSEDTNSNDTDSGDSDTDNDTNSDTEDSDESGDDGEPEECDNLIPTGHQVGDIVPNFEYPDIDGNIHRLHDHCKKAVLILAGDE